MAGTAINNNGTIYNSTYDDHGTHVAGTIGAVATTAPVSSECSATGAPNSSRASSWVPMVGTTTDAIELIDYMIALKTHNGLNLVALNNSWGGGGYDTALFTPLSGPPTRTFSLSLPPVTMASIPIVAPAYPACYDTTAASTQHYNSVISVTAIDKYGAIASFANFGANTNRFRCPRRRNSLNAKKIPIRILQRNVHGDSPCDRSHCPLQE